MRLGLAVASGGIHGSGGFFRWRRRRARRGCFLVWHRCWFPFLTANPYLRGGEVSAGLEFTETGRQKQHGIFKYVTTFSPNTLASNRIWVSLIYGSSYESGQAKRWRKFASHDFLSWMTNQCCWIWRPPSYNPWAMMCALRDPQAALLAVPTAHPDVIVTDYAMGE